MKVDSFISPELKLELAIAYLKEAIKLIEKKALFLAREKIISAAFFLNEVERDLSKEWHGV